MASLRQHLFVLAIFLLSFSLAVLAADPDPLQDFCVTDTVNQHHVFLNGLPCKNRSSVTAADFKSSILMNAGDTSNPLGVAISLASGASFGGLNTQGLSVVRIDYAEGGLVPPHVHPRATEVLLVTKGKISAGFVDTNNVLFAETLQAGELFIFPRGLVHYSYNVGKGAATSVSSLNSQNPGVSLLELALFGAKPAIPDVVLEKTFALTQQQVEQLKKTFG